jgi:hypothetical protein
MKLRLRSNTIRLRLLKGEVDRLAEGKTIVETLPTPRPFHFSVQPAEVADLMASFDEDTLLIQVPQDWARAWPKTDQVGRSATTNNLDILIEKDWACTTPRAAEENDGTYPNPTALR